MNQEIQDAYAALRWQLDAGVDESIALNVTNWLEHKEKVEELRPVSAASASAAPAATRPVSTAPRQPVPASRAGAIADARKAADAADSLDALKAALEGFEGCSLKATAMNVVFADGNRDAKLMAIGEAPDAEEDKKGIPFCGASGELLDKMFAAIGLSREESLYISNMLFWRPPGNRKPTADELEICRPFVEKHIALKAPEQLVLIGGTATSTLLGETRGITRLRGKTFEYTNDYLQGRNLPVHVLFHPSYLLRQPGQKALAWQDLLRIKAAL